MVQVTFAGNDTVNLSFDSCFCCVAIVVVVVVVDGDENDDDGKMIL